MLSDEQIDAAITACAKEDHTKEGWVKRQRRVWARAIEAEALKSQQQAINAAVMADAERYRYAMDWGTKDFAICMRDGMDWTPIKNSGPLDCAMARTQPAGPAT